MAPTARKTIAFAASLSSIRLPFLAFVQSASAAFSVSFAALYCVSASSFFCPGATPSLYKLLMRSNVFFARSVPACAFL